MKFLVNLKHDGVSYDKGADVPEKLQKNMKELGYGGTLEVEEKKAPTKKAPVKKDAPAPVVDEAHDEEKAE